MKPLPFFRCPRGNTPAIRLQLSGVAAPSAAAHDTKASIFPWKLDYWSDPMRDSGYGAKRALQERKKKNKEMKQMHRKLKDAGKLMVIKMAIM